MSICHCLLPALGKFSKLVRMGCHGLPRDSGSWAGIPRIDRVCRFCGVGSLGDEKLLVLACPHLQFIQDEFEGLFQVRTMMQFF
jgi:hypothetical protein